MSTQDSDQLGGAASVGARPVAAASVALGPVVRGGRLKKPWVPELALDDTGSPLQHEGAYFIALSGNDYGLGQFLFGTANSNGRRNLPKTNIVRRIWKARIAMQADAEDQVLTQQFPVTQGDEVLADIFGDAPSAVDAAPRPRPSLDMLPRFFHVVLGSVQDKGSVTFVVPRAKDSCVPCIELKATVLEDLLGEIAGDGQWGAESSVGSPNTPQRKRRSSPLVRSPGDSPKGRLRASGSSRCPKKKKRGTAGIHHDTKAKRVVATWKKQDGSKGQKSFQIARPESKQVVQEVKERARKHIKDHNYLRRADA